MAYEQIPKVDFSKIFFDFVGRINTDFCLGVIFLIIAALDCHNVLNSKSLSFAQNGLLGQEFFQKSVFQEGANSLFARARSSSTYFETK